MSDSYSSDGRLDIRSLRHDLVGVLCPFETALSCMKSGQEKDGLMLQEEVLKKLTVIIERLKQTPNQPHETEQE